MPAVNDISTILELYDHDPHYRILACYDAKSGVWVYGRFAYDLNPCVSHKGIQQLFSQSWHILQTPDDHLHSEVTLPIVRYIGWWSVTVIRRNHQGKLFLSNAQDAKAEDHIGLEHQS